MRTLILSLVVACMVAPAAGDPSPALSTTARHLLAGVRAFQQSRYEDALVELRVVARAADAPADLAFYLGPTLFKLGRYRDALAVFVTSRAPADTLTRFYLGETYYRLGMYRNALTVFVALRAGGMGPALDDAAGRYVSAIDLAYARPPESGTLDVYIEQGLALLAADPVVAAEYLDEARRAESRARAPHRHLEILGALGTAWNATNRASSVVEALGEEKHPSSEVLWQLARAYAVLGDPVRAGQALDDLEHAGSAHAEDAAVLRAKLIP